MIKQGPHFVRYAVSAPFSFLSNELCSLACNHQGPMKTRQLQAPFTVSPCRLNRTYTLYLTDTLPQVYSLEDCYPLL
jgi:hypothetical protein